MSAARTFVQGCHLEKFCKLAAILWGCNHAAALRGCTTPPSSWASSTIAHLSENDLARWSPRRCGQPAEPLAAASCLLDEPTEEWAISRSRAAAWRLAWRRWRGEGNSAELNLRQKPEDQLQVLRSRVRGFCRRASPQGSDGFSASTYSRPPPLYSSPSASRVYMWLVRHLMRPQARASLLPK